jgi:hypothetical protein
VSAARTRLVKLETQERERVAAVLRSKERLAGQAMDQMTATDRAAFEEMSAAERDRPAWYAEVIRAGELYGTAPNLPGGEAARDWWVEVETTPEGIAWTAAPIGAVAYFQAEAGRCDAAKAAQDSGAWELLEGVQASATDAAFRWNGAHWRWRATVARIIGGRL